MWPFKKSPSRWTEDQKSRLALALIEDTENAADYQVHALLKWADASPNALLLVPMILDGTLAVEVSSASYVWLSSRVKAGKRTLGGARELEV